MKKKRPNGMVWGGILITALILAYTFFSERGLIKSRVLSLQRDAIALKANKIEIENRHLSTEVNSLQNDMKEIEKAARSELDMVREDEILYKFNK